MPERASLRKEKRALRDALTPETAAALNRRIEQRLIQLPEFRQAAVIMGFHAFGSEVNLMPVLEQAMEHGVRVVLPRVEGNHLVAVPYTGPGDTRPGPYGIAEPGGEPIDPGVIELILVPGLVFDRSGYRLGYGKGYYDRFLPSVMRKVPRIGVAFDFQVVDDVFPTERDERLTLLVTEAQLLRFPE
ncbi:MAG: 5-formyltetrahydrofolate cyclo-ligase [Solirubrobacterales bacterium]